VAGLTLLLVMVGCAATRTATLHREVANLAPDRPITVYTLDDRVYVLQQHVLEDSSIRGRGTVQWRGHVTPFDGSIPLDSIVAVGTNSRIAMRRLVAIGVTTLFVLYVVEGVGGNRGFTAREDSTVHSPTVGDGIGTSCPYIYAWNGTRYELEAEPFGVAWGRALEMTTRHLLPTARADHGVLRLRLTNERREIHYVNSIRLCTLDLGDAPAAVLDVDGTAWPLSNPETPLSARDREGRDIGSLVAAADGRLWECDLASLTHGSGYEDVIEVAFPRRAHATAGTLVVTGINTTLSNALYDRLCRVVGDRTPALAHAVETNADLISEVKAYLGDASLAAFVWNGRAWEPAGAFGAEASAVAFTRALRLRVPDGAGDTVRVRLRSMADIWKIDALAVDWSESRPLRPTPVALRSATGPEGEDLSADLAADDDRRAILLPRDRVELSFAAPRARPGARVAYAVAARGYLHEWHPGMMDAEAAALPSVSTEQRIALLVELLRHRDAALQPVYEAWRRDRAR
jgi:hypothetical protein